MLVSPEQYADVARVAVSEGYDAIKVDVLAMDDRATGTSVTSRACCRTTSCAWAMTA